MFPTALLESEVAPPNGGEDFSAPCAPSTGRAASLLKPDLHVKIRTSSVVRNDQVTTAQAFTASLLVWHETPLHKLVGSHLHPVKNAVIRELQVESARLYLSMLRISATCAHPTLFALEELVSDGPNLKSRYARRIEGLGIANASKGLPIQAMAIYSLHLA